MDTAQAKRLIELNSAFYRKNADSFAQTRQSAWPGWTRCLEHVDNLGAGNSGAEGPHAAGGADQPYRVLDVACGNLRFEAHLQRTCSSRPLGHPLERPLELYAIDNCDALQAEGLVCGGEKNGPLAELRFQSLDVLGCLADAWVACGEDVCGGDASRGDAPGGAADCAADLLARSIGAPPCDLSVSFGFMHHVPRAAWRTVLLRALIDKTVPGGYVCVSFWQFMNDAGLAQKAVATTAAAREALALGDSALEEGDYLLGWNGRADAYRYCHHFTDAEVDQLIAAVADVAAVVARFSADGRTGALNSYLVLQRRC